VLDGGELELITAEVEFELTGVVVELDDDEELLDVDKLFVDVCVRLRKFVIDVILDSK
jgi:hypothetical protein